MNRYKCTYWALGKMFYGDVHCDSLKWGIKIFKNSPNFERFEEPVYQVR